MSQIINFPLIEKHNEIPEVDIDYAKMYEPNDDIVCTDKCFRCGKAMKHECYDKEVWYFVNQRAGYGSDIDGSHVTITICDSCMMEFLKK